MTQKSRLILPGEAGGINRNSAPQILQQMNRIQEYLAYLEQGIIQFSNALQHMSMEVNMSRLTYQMVFKMLIDKGFVTKEEVEERYNNEVVKPIKEKTEELQKKLAEMQAQQQQAQAQQEEPLIQVPVHTEPKSEEESVVAPEAPELGGDGDEG